MDIRLDLSDYNRTINQVADKLRDDVLRKRYLVHPELDEVFFKAEEEQLVLNFKDSGLIEVIKLNENKFTRMIRHHLSEIVYRGDVMVLGNNHGCIINDLKLGQFVVHINPKTKIIHMMPVSVEISETLSNPKVTKLSKVDGAMFLSIPVLYAKGGGHYLIDVSDEVIWLEIDESYSSLIMDVL